MPTAACSTLRVSPSWIGAASLSSGSRTAGGSLSTLADAQASEMVVNPEKLTFKAGIAYYPECGHTSGKVMFPVLIMIGQDDQWVRAKS